MSCYFISPIFITKILSNHIPGKKLFGFYLLSGYMEVSFFGEKEKKLIIQPDNDDIHKRYIHYNIKQVSIKTSRTTTDNQTSIANFPFSNFHNSQFKLLLHVSAYIHFINTNIKILPFQPFCLPFLRHLQPLSMPSPLLLDFSETCQTEA